MEDISAEGLELTRAEEERETFNEEKTADNSYVNSERGEFSSETLTIASTTRMFLRTKEVTEDDKVVNKGKQLKTTHSMTMDGEPQVTETHGLKHLNVFQRGTWKAIKNNPQWKAVV